MIVMWKSSVRDVTYYLTVPHLASHTFEYPLLPLKSSQFIIEMRLEFYWPLDPRQVLEVIVFLLLFLTLLNVEYHVSRSPQPLLPTQFNSKCWYTQTHFT